MCILLNQQQKNGKGRNYQFEQWQQYFTWERQGHKFIITSIHEFPILKIDNRKDNNNIYGKYIEKLILDLLYQKQQSKNNNRRLYLSRDQMLQALNMVNSNYHYVKFNTGKVADFLKIDNENIKEFFNINNRNLNDAVERSLKRLESKFLVIWNLVHTIVLNEEVIILDEHGKEIKLKENHVTAGKIELEYINTYEKMVAGEMGYTKKQEIFLAGRYPEFTKKVCSKLQEQDLNILYYYKSYDIIFHPDIVMELDKLNQFLLEYEERKNVKITLNGIVSKQIIINTEKRNQEAKNQIMPTFGERLIVNADYEERKLIRRSQKKYITETTKIIDTVINPKARNIIDKVNTYERTKRKTFNKKIDTILN